MSEEKDEKKDKCGCECGDKCNCTCCSPKKWHHRGHRGGMNGGSIYYLGMIGVAVYYIQQVSGFWPVVVAILKAIVWPAFLLFKVFSMLHM
jgi:hypothetical protein